jgi:hypothetical protein
MSLLNNTLSDDEPRFRRFRREDKADVLAVEPMVKPEKHKHATPLLVAVPVAKTADQTRLEELNTKMMAEGLSVAEYREQALLVAAMKGRH